MMQPFIHLIPYAQDGNIAAAYNEAIECAEGPPWILLTDADVMLLTPRYGQLIAEVIAANPGAGLITCVTNRIGPTCQRAAEVPPMTADLIELREAAVARWIKHGAKVTSVEPPCSGFFLLFRREVWKAVGGFKGCGLLGVDWRFSRDVAAAGLPILRMDGLLAVHFYRLNGSSGPSSGALPKAASGKAAPRTDILNTLARTRGLRAYLEIGVRHPADNYQRIQCEEKTGVDLAPVATAPGIVWQRSDDFFHANRGRFDLIFIDGDHRTEAVARDIANGLAALSPSGVLVMHDALPPAETFTREEDRKANRGSWTGGVWEAVLRHFSQSEHHCCIVDADWGVAIVDTRKPRDHAPLPALPEGALDYAAHFPLLAPFRVPLEKWRAAQEPARDGGGAAEGERPTPSIRIMKWFGRLGNNLVQLAHAVYLAQELGVRQVEHPAHRLLRGRRIDLGAGFGDHPGLSGGFFHGNSLAPHAAPLPPGRRKRICMEFLLPKLIGNDGLGHAMECHLQRESTLVIYVRTGDVFGAYPHRGYIQPPLWFYQTILEAGVWEDVILVSEDDRNPVIPRLCADYPKIRIHRASLAEDFAVLCKARNLVGANGTFTQAAFYLNAGIQRYWVPGFLQDGVKFASAFPGLVTLIQCPGYLRVGDWRNTAEQRQIMLDYRKPQD